MASATMPTAHSCCCCSMRTFCTYILLMSVAVVAVASQSSTQFRHPKRQLLANSGSLFDVEFEGECRPEILYHCSHVLSAAQRASSFKSQSEELVKALGSAVEAAKAQAVASPENQVASEKPQVSPNPSSPQAQATGKGVPDASKASSSQAADAQGAEVQADTADDEQVAGAVAAAAEEDEDAREFEKQERQSVLKTVRDAQVTSKVALDLNGTSNAANQAVDGKDNQDGQDANHEERLSQLQQSLNQVSDATDTEKASTVHGTAGQQTGAVAAAAEEEEDAKEFEKDERQAALSTARDEQVVSNINSKSSTSKDSTADAELAAVGQANSKQFEAQQEQQGETVKADSNAGLDSNGASGDILAQATVVGAANRRSNQDLKRTKQLQEKLNAGAADADTNTGSATDSGKAGAFADAAEEEEAAKGFDNEEALLAAFDGQGMVLDKQAGSTSIFKDDTATDKKASSSEDPEEAKRRARAAAEAHLKSLGVTGLASGAAAAGEAADSKDPSKQGQGKASTDAGQATGQQTADVQPQTDSTGAQTQDQAAGAGTADRKAAGSDTEAAGASNAGSASGAAQSTVGDEQQGVVEGLRGTSRRQLMGMVADTGSSSILQQREFHKHEADELQNQQESVSEVLRGYGMDPGMPVAALLSATAPIARCLRQAIRDSQLSISPATAQVSLSCQENVRSFLIDRAADVQRDPPLIAACAEGILKQCRNVSSAGGQLFHCLKANKAQLPTLCRAAVVARQVDASEDMALDAVLSAACGADRQRLCADAGWGEGAAQSCLEEVLHVELLSGMKGDDQLQREQREAEREGKSAKQGQLGLSPACASALFHRQMEESEDIRFSFRMSHACAGDKHMFCRDVRPGVGDVVGCLEQHSVLPGFSDVCRAALEYHAQLRASDVRLDARFRAVCSKDVQALCLDVEAKILSNPDEPPGAGARVMECMRRVREDIRNDACSAHVQSLMRAAYLDNRLDVLFMDRCDEDASKLCIDKRGTLECLRAKLITHEPLQPECAEMVRERSRQAAADITFMPRLEEACSVEVASLCRAKHLKGAQVLDCLADQRRNDVFGERCREALVAHLSDAVSDVRMLHTLKEDCEQDIKQLCGQTAFGEGRVLACLQQQRANITAASCKKQMLRMLGLAVEDYRLDYSLSQACKADVQQHCAGVDSRDTGAVHQCLRRSMEHLSDDCRTAQEALETIEHEDVRLNPRIQRECPLAINMFCAGEVAPGSANVITCLQEASSKPAFPEECRAVMQSLMERSSLKYSLNPKLKGACDADVSSMCPDASDEPSSAADPGVLGCLAANSSALSRGCRSEMAALVRLHLNSYHMGMPLTSVCDGDVLARCNVEKQVAPFLMGGYVLSCLSKSFNKLHTPCWSLISMFDEGQYQSATQVEGKPWSEELQQEAIDKMRRQVAAEVRGDLELKMLHNLDTKVESAVEVQHSKMKPLVYALLNAASILMAVVAVLTLVAWFLWNKYARRAADGSRARTIAVKDGRV